MAHDNYMDDRGEGHWVITTYNPEKEFGPYNGLLFVSKEFHVIYASFDPTTGKGKECIASFPSPNVAAAVNTNLT